MKVLKNLFISAFLLSAGSAWAAPVESFETGLTNWSLQGVATPGPTFVITGSVGGINPTDGTAMVLFNCANCSEMTFIHYDLSAAPLAVGINDYVVIDVFSNGTSRNMYLRMSDGTQWVTLGTNNTAVLSGPCTEDGIVGDGRWEALSSKAADGIAGVTLTSITQLDVMVGGPYSTTAPLYLDNLRTLTAGGSGLCSALPTPTNTVPPGGCGVTTCTPTNTIPPASNCGLVTCTPTDTIPIVDCGIYTCTLTNTPTPTATVTTTPTATPTNTATALPLMTFPNPIDFQELGVDSSGKTIDFQCHGGAGEIPGNLFGCIKINGLERGTTLKIYTLSLSHVRTFTVDDTTAVFPAPDKNDFNRALPNNGNPNVGQIVWDGTNENRNPVASGVYFYTYEGGTAGKVIGKFAIKRARK